ncbi:MAG: hypothetical protein B7X61_15785 [Gallionellales bacterium 39-52-133]|jgi:hypothetical protein|nr:MAG: hypothetical protein B7X61_15785 [Gallionellales bacterium 39-52-133]
MQLEDSNTPDVTNNAPADSSTVENTLPNTGEDTGSQANSNLEAAADALVDTSNDDLPTDKPASSKMKALLDEMSGDTPPADPAATTPPADEQDPPAGTVDPAAPPAPPAEPKTPEQEEAELLDGVKSDRGKERIRQVFSERKQLESDINEFKALITDTKMSPEEFAQTLEFGRLMNSGDEKDLRVAFEMVEQQRAVLAQRLGVKAPGVDLLAGHDDLKQAVENMEITEDRALELAKYRKQDAEKQQVAQAQQQSAQNQEQFNKTVQSAATQMEAYLNTRANEADSPIKLKAISEHFKNPANLQAFVTTYQPDQWVNTLKLMYDNIVVPKAPAAAQPQPLRSRPATLGSPSTSGQTPIDRVASRLDSMGI